MDKKKYPVVTANELIKTLDANGKLKRNLERPPLKDTIAVPEGGYLILRFVADNPGVWLVHCHLDFHSEVGMGFLLRVGTDSDLPKKPKGWQTCGSYFDTM
jgi:L-ascorbate oxidase